VTNSWAVWAVPTPSSLLVRGAALLHWAMTGSDALHSGTQTQPIMGLIEWFKCFSGATYEGEPPLCSAPPMPSGSMQ
jgi:hypothetical protein